MRYPEYVGGRACVRMCFETERGRVHNYNTVFTRSLLLSSGLVVLLPSSCMHARQCTSPKTGFYTVLYSRYDAPLNNTFVKADCFLDCASHDSTWIMDVQNIPFACRCIGGEKLVLEGC